MLTFAMALGIGYGYLRRGSLTALANLPWRRVWLAAVAFGLQALAVWGVGVTGPQGVGASLHIASYLLLGLFIWSNWRLAGMKIVAAGLLLNFLVIATNGGYMPIAPETLAARGDVERASMPSGSRMAGSKDILLAREDTRLWILSDVITIPLPLWRRAFSVGDVVLAAGLFYLIQAGMRASPRSNHHKQRGSMYVT